eukprot:342420-Prymnesium_polylepis.2
MGGHKKKVIADRGGFTRAVARLGRLYFILQLLDFIARAAQLFAQITDLLLKATEGGSPVYLYDRLRERCGLRSPFLPQEGCDRVGHRALAKGAGGHQCVWVNGSYNIRTRHGGREQ